jgi:hypothetical protein
VKVCLLTGIDENVSALANNERKLIVNSLNYYKIALLF